MQLVKIDRTENHHLFIWIISVVMLISRHETKVADFKTRTDGARDLELFCETESLNISCADDHVLLLTHARYGRMKLSRCVSTDYGHLGCSAQVLELADTRCSGRPSCEITIPDPLFTKTKPCPEDLKPYLELDYQCVKVHSSVENSKEDQVRCNTHLALSQFPSGYISNYITEQTGCGGLMDPWILTTSPGRRLQISLLDFNVARVRPLNYVHPRCPLYAVIEEPYDANIDNGIIRRRSTRHKFWSRDFYHSGKEKSLQNAQTVFEDADPRMLYNNEVFSIINNENLTKLVRNTEEVIKNSEMYNGYFNSSQESNSTKLYLRSKSKQITNYNKDLDRHKGNLLEINNNDDRFQNNVVIKSNEVNTLNSGVLRKTNTEQTDAEHYTSRFRPVNSSASDHYSYTSSYSNSHKLETSQSHNGQKDITKEKYENVRKYQKRDLRNDSGKKRRKITICGGMAREKSVYTSTGHRLEIGIARMEDPEIGAYFLLKYEVLGCEEPDDIVDATYIRQGDHVVYRCNQSHQEFSLRCVNNQWTGAMYNCSTSGSSLLVILITALCIGLLVLIAGQIVLHRRRILCQSSDGEDKNRTEMTSLNTDYVIGTPQCSSGLVNPFDQMMEFSTDKIYQHHQIQRPPCYPMSASNLERPASIPSPPICNLETNCDPKNIMCSSLLLQHSKPCSAAARCKQSNVAQLCSCEITSCSSCEAMILLSANDVTTLRCCDSIGQRVNANYRNSLGGNDVIGDVHNFSVNVRNDDVSNSCGDVDIFCDRVAYSTQQNISHTVEPNIRNKCVNRCYQLPELHSENMKNEGKESEEINLCSRQNYGTACYTTVSKNYGFKNTPEIVSDDIRNMNETLAWSANDNRNK